MTRFNPEKVLILYSVIGALFTAYVALAPSFSAVYVAVLVSVLFGLLDHLCRNARYRR